MMNSPVSGSDSRKLARTAFELLHPKVQKWIWDQQWDQLRPTQIRAIAPILTRERDVLIAAPTASGKTEAAWLPICSALASNADRDEAWAGVKALYISPLKALINDQFERLQTMFERIDMPVSRRHGDVGGSERHRLVSDPDGVLLITPEALEALFVLHGTRVPMIFYGLQYIVIDEVHSFIGAERGAQLQSLLDRIELAIRRPIPRIGLSATIADTGMASEFLRPGAGEQAIIIDGSDEAATELKLQVRGHVVFAGQPRADFEDDDDAGAVDDAIYVNQAIAKHLFKTFRGSDNLIFANSRHSVESYADRLRQISDSHRVPNEFYPHHGNLSKELREDVERKLKARDEHATAICTSTLEMGIDIGSTDSIAQLGAPTNVSALRQRLGRSGRRGDPASLRVYVTETQIGATTPPVDQLRSDTIQSIAVIELLLEKWYEPPNTTGLHLSTLIQQILSLIAQHGGATAPQLFGALCTEGPFVHVSQPMFIQLLRDLASADLLIQAADGLLLHGGIGERIVNHYSFYAAFQSQEEYRLVTDGQTLGSMPIDHPVTIGSLLVFAGRRWLVLVVDSAAKVIELRRAAGGIPPLFGGNGPEIADGVRKKMKSVYEGVNVPAYLDSTAQRLLDEGRKSFRRMRLGNWPLVAWGNDTIVFPWRGDRVMNTLCCLLRAQGVTVSQDGISLTCNGTSFAAVEKAANALANSPKPSAIDLARPVKIKVRDKYDCFLGEELLTGAYAARDLDIDSVWDSLIPILEHRADITE